MTSRSRSAWPQWQRVLLDHVDDGATERVPSPVGIARDRVHVGDREHRVDQGDLVPERGERAGDGGIRGHVPLLLVVEQRRYVGGDQHAAEPPSLDVGHVPHEPEQRQPARRHRGGTRLLVAETVELPREHGAVVGEVAQEHRTLVLPERLRLGQWLMEIGHRPTMSYEHPTIKSRTGPRVR